MFVSLANSKLRPRTLSRHASTWSPKTLIDCGYLLARRGQGGSSHAGRCCDPTDPAADDALNASPLAGAKGQAGYAVKVLPPPGLRWLPVRAVRALFDSAVRLRMRRVIQQPYRLR